MPAAVCATSVYGRRCTKPGTRRVTFGCVHEHIVTGDICSEHFAGLITGNGWCFDCHCGPDPHECRLIGREVPA